MLLTEETSDVVDLEILERYLPVIQELQLPIVVPEGSATAFLWIRNLPFKKSHNRE